jgi:Cof subfamily protein (haloacid dehalogenase superfamily)
VSRYRLVAVDLDGTTLQRDGTISPAVERAVRRAGEAGARVMLATGRMGRSARRYWEMLRLPPGPVICYQGAEVLEVPEDRVWYRDVLPDAGARRLVTMTVQAGFLCQVYIGEDLWVSREDDRVTHYVETNRIPALVRPLPLLTGWGEPPVKLLIQGTPEQLAALRARLDPVARGYGIRLVSSQKDFLEAVPNGVGKGRALERVAARLRIPREAVMAVGDGENDADMLAWAGLGVAMGHGHPAALAAADVVAPPVEADGLAWAIDAYILGERCET